MEMVQQKIISIPQMMVMLDMPDIEGEAELRAAPLTDIDGTIARFLEDDPPAKKLRRPEVKEELEAIVKIEDADEREEARETLHAELLYEAPTGAEALEEGIVRFQNAYLLARHSDVSPQRLQLLLDWIDEANAILQEAAMAGQANAIGAGPSGTPGMPPGMPPMPGAPVGPEQPPMGPPMPPAGV